MRRKVIVRTALLLPLPLALLARYIAAHNSEAVERLFSTGIYPRVAEPVSRIMGLCPVPVVELLLIAWIVFTLYSLLRRRFFRVIAVMGLLAALVVGGWGLNYFRLPLEDTLGLTVRDAEKSELISLCDALVEDANAWHSDMPRDTVLSKVPEAMNAAAQAWPVGEGRFAPPKQALSSPLLSRLMIQGIISPFTAEALVNGEIPAVSLPYVGCHEAAHIRGFAREEDANLIAYLACTASDIPFFRYSGAVGALLPVFNALREADMDEYRTCRSRLSPEVEADLSEYSAFWAQYEKAKAAQVGTRVNDTYLQAISGGEQSVRSYGYVVDLLLALHREGKL